MLPAVSKAANPTGTGPASATRPWPSCSMAAGSTGQDGGIAACQSRLTDARSAAAANGRIRQLTPVIIPPVPARRPTPSSGAGPAHREHHDNRIMLGWVSEVPADLT